MKDEAYEALEKTADFSLNQYKIVGTTDAKSVTSAVKASKKHIDSAFKQAKKAVFSDTNTESFLWHIYDNKYLYDEKYSELEASLNTLKALPCCKGNTDVTQVGSYPYYFMCFFDYLEQLEDTDGAEFITAFAKSVGEKNGISPSINDFFSLGTLFEAGVFVQIGKLCKNKDTDIASKKIILMTRALRQVSEYSFDKYFEKSKAEEYLKKDPSGYYVRMTEETKNIYRRHLSFLASKSGISETEYAKNILQKASVASEKRKKHIGYYLYPYLGNERKKLYFVLLFSLTASLTAILGIIHPVNILAFLPLWELCSGICSRIFSSFTTSYPLPCLDIQKLPDNGGVLTVITAIPQKNLADTLITRLENMFISTGLDNTYFALLCDFPESINKDCQSDNEIFSHLCDRIESLNFKYGNRFFLFVRPKVFNKDEGKFMGHERKRGEINELCSYLSGLSECPFIPCKCLPGNGICDRIRYILTLDSDTEVPPDSIKKLSGIMLHPLNIPEIDSEKGIVKSGYGMLQPGVSSCLSSWRKTAFTGIMGTSGGFEIYSFAGFELYQSVFGEGSFCGKGFFDKIAFCKCLVEPCKAFPENLILSHDLPEGERLRTANVTNVNFLDSFPSDSVSYLKRLHRWIRGDTQNLYFLKKHIRNVSAEAIINNISPLSKFKLFDCFRRDIVPVFSYICIMLSLFLPAGLASLTALFSLMYILFGFIWHLSFAVSDISIRCAARKYFSRNALPGIFTSLFRVYFEISMLPSVAITSADAVCRSLYRMLISKSKLLEWTTAHDSEQTKKNNLLYYIRKNLFCAVSGTALYVFSSSGILKLVGLMWFLFPICAFLSGKAIKQKENIPTLKQYETIKEYAEKTWNYFKDAVSDKSCFLPVDNIQLYPALKHSKITSPTNIGLYMASALAARDFGFINTDELHSRLLNTLKQIERLKKWKGHLYNWYCTQDGSVIPPYIISSVDSGNFLACLICLKEGLKEYVYQNAALVDIIGKIENIIDNTDISALYDKDKKLFYISADIGSDGRRAYSSNHFDMLMSEARTLSYIAVSKKVCGVEHFAKLSRPCVKHSDRVGFASWTGTAFEYFMPALFMPSPKGSLMYEALRFALYRQKSRCAKTPSGKVFGISESAYHTFDSDMNYQYMAFGIPELAYKSGLEKELVISPYSSFIMMPMDIKSTLSNLEKLKKEKLYDPYGFYEAYDFTPSRCLTPKIVKSNMAHHSGMSLIACANTVFGNSFVRRFMNDSSMRSFGMLLEERIPIDAAVRRLDSSKNIPDKTR